MNRNQGRAIKGVLFDLDNTLYDRDAAFTRWAHCLITTHLIALDADARAKALQTIVSLDEHGYTPKPLLFQKFRQHYPELRLTVNELINLFRNGFAQHGILELSTQMLLTALNAHGLPFGIVTNGAKSQWNKIRHLGLDHQTQCIFVSEEFGCKKPQPAIFLAAAQCLGISPPHILFVGDHPELDIYGAQNVGMQTAWLHENRLWPPTISGITPNFTIGSLAELSRIVIYDDNLNYIL